MECSVTNNINLLKLGEEILRAVVEATSKWFFKE
jgi:hypothetical protein